MDAKEKFLFRFVPESEIGNLRNLIPRKVSQKTDISVKQSKEDNIDIFPQVLTRFLNKTVNTFHLMLPSFSI